MYVCECVCVCARLCGCGWVRVGWGCRARRVRWRWRCRAPAGGRNRTPPPLLKGRREGTGPWGPRGLRGAAGRAWPRGGRAGRAPALARGERPPRHRRPPLAVGRKVSFEAGTGRWLWGCRSQRGARPVGAAGEGPVCRAVIARAGPAVGRHRWAAVGTGAGHRRRRERSRL